MIRRLLLCFVLAASAFATSGSFAGQVVSGPHLDGGKKWIFIQGAHGSIRRVNINTARITFSSSVDKKERDSRPEDAIREGTQVRVTASQDEQGEWKASVVEIVNPAPK